MSATSILRHGRLRAASAADAARRQARVIWMGPEPAPDDEERRAVHDAIRRRGLEMREQIAIAVAEELFALDFARGGWLADIGFFRSWYRSGADRLLTRLDGTTIRIVPAQVATVGR